MNRLGLWLGYSIMGTIVFAVMQALGEMISHLPVSGGHITLARRFVGEDMAFAVGWEYWYNWTIVLPAELSAAAVLVHYWTESVNDAVWVSANFWKTCVPRLMTLRGERSPCSL